MASEQISRPTRPSAAVLGLDIAERIFVVGLFLQLVYRVFDSVAGGSNPVNLLLLMSEGLVVALVMLRRPATEISLRPLDWFLAFAATAGPLLVRPAHVHPVAPPAWDASLMLTGIVLQIVCKLTLRRSFGLAPANRGLVIVGPYRFVRHPIYASYLVNQLGFLLLNPTAWNVAVLGGSLAIQLFRIAAEERLLAHDERHAAFRQAVPYRLVPGLY